MDDSTEKTITTLDELARHRVDLATSFARLTQWAGVGVILAALGAWAALRQYPQLLWFAIAVLGMVAFCWAYQVLVKRGRVKTAGLVYLSGFMTFSAACPFLLPGALAAIVVCYLFVLLLCCMLLGQRWFWVFLAASLVYFSANMLYTSNPDGYWFPALPWWASAILGIGIGATTIVALAWYLRLTIFNQNALFQDSQRLKGQLEAKVAQEEHQRILTIQTVSDYVDVMRLVGLGNLAARIPIDARVKSEEDPLVSLGLELNQTITILESMMDQINEASSSLTAASAEILAAVNQQASGSSEQSAAISQTTTSLAEVRAIAGTSVDRAQEVMDAAQQAADVSRSGQQAIQETIEGMAQIKQRVEAISLTNATLSGQTRQIGAIVTAVNDLAEQSNMLALNAAVEAARAGEHGKGFAVVAKEVRSLAEQSQRATAQIKAILQEIQKAAAASAQKTQEGISVVEEGGRLSAHAQQTIDKLAGVINQSVDQMVKVMTGGRQQSTGLEQISTAMTSIQQVSVQTLASTRQVAESAQDLNDLAIRLNSTLARYKNAPGVGQVDQRHQVGERPEPQRN